MLALVVYALVRDGRTEDEIKEWVMNAFASGTPTVEFNAPEDGALNVVSKEKNPMQNQLIEDAESESESESRSHITE